ncbi:MAG: hypothetical protein LQ338_006344 [Usnochroma carphineum]|nr:MAG: hypothetical protein LQ338_006344 [Usnochroma carphineum]
MADLPPHVDVLIIGAGLQGLVAAKTYLQLSPRTNLLILDSQHSIGGVWAKENLYPGLRTNNQLGTFEFTDFNISDACPGKVSPGEHIQGEVVHEYLYKYAERFDLLKRIRLGYKVLTAEHLPRGWKLTIVPTPDTTSIPEVDDYESDTLRQDASTTTLTTSKLFVCTGMTSKPVPISLPGSSTFTPPLLTFHSFRQQASHLLSSRDIHHVAIYGGAKSAYDVVYAFASRSTPENPKRVTWIIRESGHGPVYMAPAHIYLGPLRCWLELLVTVRLLTWFSPCIWGERDGFGFVRRWLHNTRIGRWVVQAFWKKLGGDVVAQTGLRTKGPEVAKLLPKESAFWSYGAGVSILNYERDIHDFVRDGTVRVVRADVERLDGKTVRLKGGEDVEVDAMICSTGWRWDSGIEFLPKSEHADLGIPSAGYSLARKEQWAQLDAQADAEILERFPMLATGPAIRKEDTVIPKPKDPSVATAANEKLKAEPDKQRKEELTPWRLFRGIAPPANPKRDLVFLGMMLSLQTVLRSEIAALWAYAYLNNTLAPPAALSTHPPSTLAAVNEKSAEPKHPWLYETALFSRFGRWRYPMGYGARFPDFIFDGLPYFDMLMQDLGLRRWRKGWGWLGEVFGGAYMRGDYRGLVEEWRTLEMKIRDG